MKKLFNVEVEQIEQKIDWDHKNLSNIKIDDDQAESKQGSLFYFQVFWNINLKFWLFKSVVYY